jgi:hypothetical protein
MLGRGYLKIRFSCPTCKAVLNAPASRAGAKINCPKCTQRILVPGQANKTALGQIPPVTDKTALGQSVATGPAAPSHRTVDVPCPGCKRVIDLPVEKLGTHIECAECGAQFVARTTLASTDGVDLRHNWGGLKRRLSLPWLVAIFIFGFLPWSEVSCSHKDFPLRVSQSGCQAVYGGVSSPFDFVEAAQQAAQKKFGTDKEALAKAIDREHSDYLLSCSPFVVVFWVGILALAVCTWAAPLGVSRLRICLGLSGLLALMLLLIAALGTPLERRAAWAMGEIMKTDPDQALAMTLLMTSGKTCWFWLAFGAVGLVACTEYLSWFFFKTGKQFPPALTVGLAGIAFLSVAGLLTQCLLWKTGLTVMENRLSKLQQIENEKTRKAEQDRKARDDERRLAEEKRQADHTAQQKALALERERDRLEAERKARERQEKAEQDRLEAERKARERQEELAAQASAEREKRKMDEAKRKADLEAQNLPYYPKPTTLHNGKNAEEWYQLAVTRLRDATIQSNASEALVALKEEGMPYLLTFLEKAMAPDPKGQVGIQMKQRGVQAILDLINPDYIHPNDLSKIVACLKAGSAADATRVQALRYLAKHAKSGSYIDRIQTLVADLQKSQRYQEEVNKLLATINGK